MGEVRYTLSMRWRRFRREWKANQIIFGAVSTGLLAGFLVSLISSETIGFIVAVLVAVVALFWRWARASRSDPPPSDTPDLAPVPASPWRIPLAALGTLAMIGAIGLATLLPAWLRVWVETDIVVFFLTVIVTTVEAYGPGTA